LVVFHQVPAIGPVEHGADDHRVPVVVHGHAVGQGPASAVVLHGPDQVAVAVVFGDVVDIAVHHGIVPRHQHIHMPVHSHAARRRLGGRTVVHAPEAVPVGVVFGRPQHGGGAVEEGPGHQQVPRPVRGEAMGPAVPAAVLHHPLEVAVGVVLDHV